MTLLDQPWLLFALLFLLLLAVVEFGHRLRPAAWAQSDVEVRESLAATRDSVSLLLSLLLGFTLAMALPRYEDRKKLLVDEANSIGTTALRAQMLPEPARGKVLQLLSSYVDARLAFSTAGVRGEELQRSLVRTKQLQDDMWKQGVAAVQQSPTPITSIFIQSLNESMDLSEKRLAALENRVPNAVWILLALVSILSCVTIGASERRRIWFVMVVSPLAIAIVMALIADLDSPRTGLLQIGQQSLSRVQRDLNSGGIVPRDLGAPGVNP